MNAPEAVNHEVSLGEEKRRVHVLVFSSDWEKLGLMYGDSVKRGNVMRMLLRDYIKATIGFEKLGEATGTQPKSLIRMFGPRGNPQARNLFSVLGLLQKRAGVQLHVTAGPA